ncbi:MAG: cytochrome c biogenesis protein CcdA [Bifidobacteriaceae bacterium]|jgi:cytochrome c-type biogenesis protein|nr:cytochrome c biogenesis protein CcdA [Bifidobacteriaceae bacterium]
MTLTVPIVLLAGIVSFASPCFLPVVPVFVGYMTGQAAGATTPRRWAAAAQAGVFMAAFAVVFAALWALVGLIGWAAADAKPALRVVGGAILVLLGLHTAGLINIPLIDRPLRAGYHPDPAAPPAWRRSLLLGLAFGAGWTPCIGPVLGGVLGLTTTTDSLAGGLGLLAVYTLGLGLPFVLVCAGATHLTGRLKWFTRHHRGVAWVTGGLLVAVGFLIITDLFSRLSALVDVGL